MGSGQIQQNRAGVQASFGELVFVAPTESLGGQKKAPAVDNGWRFNICLVKAVLPRFA
jgi:hypothetical protein